MQRFRLLVLLAACFVLGSAAWADDVGYVDCSKHSDNIQVYAKARQTPDIVASIPCGERFTVVLYGFIFSRVQTREGKIGYVYSNLITVDNGASPAPQRAPVSAAPAPPVATNSPSTAPAYAPLNSAAQMDSPPVTTSPAPPKPAAAQVPPEVSSVVSAPAASASSTPSTVSQSTTPPPADIKPATVPSAPAPTAPTEPAPAPAAPAVSQPTPPPLSEPQPAPTLPTAAQVEAATSAPAARPVSSASEAAPTPVSDPAPAPEPAPAAAAASQPQPEAAQPAPAPVRSASVRSSWEKPLPAGRQNFLLELYSGYSFARFTSVGTSTNFNGAMGSFGYNLKPWLQIVGDTSYNFVTISGVKTVLYGNHFGGRVFYRRGSRWGVTPFGEVLIGGSRLDTTVSGTGGYSTSTNCISYKAGGGLDVRASRRWEIRLIDFDYYRTAFGTNATQNNFWVSAGVILRLFGAPGE